jgi:Rrf2 family iron-sulfur cluster assembly transcriptional regulator
MWLNSTSQYAIRATLYVAGHESAGPVRVDEIAEALDCPRNYLSKTLYALVRAGVLRSTRGPGGGFQLALSPEQLSLGRVIAPFEPATARRCLIGRPDCGGAHPCLAHHRWEKVAGVVSQFFEQTTIGELLSDNSGTLSIATPPRPVQPARRPRTTARR